MSFFGSTIDASQAVPYTLNAITASPGNPLPPLPPTATTGGTKTHPKPTAHLPGGHGSTQGEASNPAFNTSAGVPQQDAAETTPSSDSGYFTGMSRLLKNSTWLIFAIGAVVLFGIGATIFFWRRSRRLARPPIDDYERVAPGEDVPMMNTSDRPSGAWTRERGTKELYDAFGEVSDDEADDQPGIRQPLQSGGVGYHSAFLEDDDPQSAALHAPYKDEPEHREKGNTSPTSNDDSSWEHASQQTKNE